MKLKFDVMYNERFIKTFVYETKYPFPPTDEELRAFVVRKIAHFKK